MLKIPENSKILSISHNDLDGVGCQIVLGQVYKNITYVNSSFYKLEETLVYVNYDEYDYVFVTDMHPETVECLNMSDKIILIDHHESEYHDPSKKRFVVSDKKKCATVLVKHFIERMYDIKLTQLDDLVKYINDYDLWELKYRRSKMINDLMFYKYRADGFRKEFFNGRIDFTDEEKRFLIEQHNRFLKVYDELEVFPLEKINGCVVYEYDFVNEISEQLKQDYGFNLIISKRPDGGRVSLRNDNPDVNLNVVLEHFGYGGGHKDAGGMFVKTQNEFNEKITKIENYIYNNIESMRI